MSHTANEFNLNDDRWEGDYVHNDNGSTFSGNFYEVYDWWGVHPHWRDEVERLAKLHGWLEFGDDDFGASIYHEDAVKPFRVYWCVSKPKHYLSQAPRLFDLLGGDGA